jgi:hypothetical protein
MKMRGSIPARRPRISPAERATMLQRREDRRLEAYKAYISNISEEAHWGSMPPDWSQSILDVTGKTPVELLRAVKARIKEITDARESERTPS